jgi:AcrR family transcriptional regulator
MSTEAVRRLPTGGRARDPARRRLVRHRLTAEAIDLFLTRGYDETTVDEIAAAAGVGRRTFFRYFQSKEDVIFPDHAQWLKRVEGSMGAAGPHDPPLQVVCQAVRIVLDSYIDEGAIAVKRYRLTREIPTLRGREIASAHRYQIAFARYLRERLEDVPGGALWAEVAAASVVAAHNHVLRRWLHAEGKGDANAWADKALRYVRETLEGPVTESPADEVMVAVLRPGVPLATVMRRIEDTLAEP